MTFDIKKARHDTPGCAHVMHFNNAGAALMPMQVRNALVGHINREMVRGGYESADEASDRLQAVYQSIATLIHASADEIALMTSASHAWVQAFYAIRFQAGDKILTARAEYAANYIAFLQMAERHGVEIVVIPNDEHGQLSVSALENLIDERVKLIAMTHIPTNGGLVNPAEAVGKIAREHGILYLLDACQSVGQMPIDVEAIGCDMLSATGRKYLRAPRGTGFLYVKRDVIPQLDPPTLDLHSARWISTDDYEMQTDARRFEKWESSIASRLGLGTAVDYALDWGMDSIWERVQAVAGELRQKLTHIPAVTVHDLGLIRCGIVTFRVDAHDENDIKEQLADQQINVTTSSRFSTRLDMEARGLETVVRASVHYYNTSDEIDRFCDVIESL
jgi:cysteine desulfurase / selenocysteine lyase